MVHTELNVKKNDGLQFFIIPDCHFLIKNPFKPYLKLIFEFLKLYLNTFTMILYLKK